MWHLAEYILKLKEEAVKEDYSYLYDLVEIEVASGNLRL
jgi:hypothetical protein